jgi:hypothetical protein
MRKKLLSAGKRAMALASALFILTATGCSFRSADSDESQTPDTSLTTESTAETSASADNTEASAKDITLTTFHFSSKVDGVERATGQYTDITFSDEIKQKYPKLVDKINELTDAWETYISQGVGEFAIWYDESMDTDTPYNNDQGVDIIRFDDRMFTVLVAESSYAGGAHPNHSTTFYNIDPVTGETIYLKNVLRNPDEFPATIREWLEKTYPETLEEIDSFNFEDSDVFEAKLNNETYSYSVDDAGLHILFSPYEVASYATGFIGVDFSYDDYPDLVQDAYKMDAPADMESRINLVDAGTIDVEAKDIPFEDYSDEYDVKLIDNPSWDYYFNGSYKKDTERHYLSLSQTKELTTDWLDTEVWASDHGVSVAQPEYSDENYTYSPYNPVEYSYMYNSLCISTVSDNVIVGDYDLTELCNGPDQKEGRNSDQTEYLRYAKIVDDILYLEISHWAYASEGPDNAYIVAIDINTGEVIFRSQPLVANGFNFLVVDDTIICGYGFTDEPDFIYLLDRYDGSVKEKIPVKSAPYQFELVDDTLYVATYNTEYEFKVTR